MCTLLDSHIALIVMRCLRPSTRYNTQKASFYICLGRNSLGDFKVLYALDEEVVALKNRICFSLSRLINIPVEVVG